MKHQRFLAETRGIDELKSVARRVRRLTTSLENEIKWSAAVFTEAECEALGAAHKILEEAIGFIEGAKQIRLSRDRKFQAQMVSRLKEAEAKFSEIRCTSDRFVFAWWIGIIPGEVVLNPLLWVVGDDVFKSAIQMLYNEMRGWEGSDEEYRAKLDAKWQHWQRERENLHQLCAVPLAKLKKIYEDGHVDQ